jgi:hypothetical protein
MDFYSTSYTDSHLELPTELLLSSAETVLFPRGEWLSYFSTYNGICAVYTYKALTYLEHLARHDRSKCARVNALIRLAKDDLRYLRIKDPDSITPPLTQPPLSWLPSLAPTTTDYIRECRSDIIRKALLRYPFTWLCEPPEWFVTQCATLGLGERYGQLTTPTEWLGDYVR